MARATRSSTTHEKDKPSASPPASRKGAPKKRKRTSNADNDDSLPAKHPRTDSKDDASPEPEDRGEESNQGELPSSGDVPIQSSDAADILDVLELCVTYYLKHFSFLTSMVSSQSRQSGSPRPRFSVVDRLW